MDKKEYFNQWAAKLSLSVEEIEKEFQEILTEEKQIHSSLAEDQQEMRALKRLALAYKKQMRSPAVGYEGFIFATSDSADIIAKKRKDATELFRNDPQTAIAQGITDEKGVPLDTREEWSTGRRNPNYGKPLPEHNYLRNIWGVAKKQKGESAPKMFQMLLSGDSANSDIPIFSPVRFQAIDKGEENGILKLNPSSFTKFVEDASIEIPQPHNIVKNYFAPVAIKNLAEYHAKYKDDFNRLVAVEGDVSMMVLEPTSVGSRILALEDDSSMDLDATGLTCWVPERINLDFAEGSKVIVLGRTAQGFVKDEDGNQTEELGDVTMNVFGIYALPEFKIELPKDIKEISEDDLE